MVKKATKRTGRKPTNKKSTNKQSADLSARLAAVVIFWLGVITLAIVLAFFIINSAKAWTETDPAIAAWFEQQYNPVIGLSCCGAGDGHELSTNDWKITKDGYKVFLDDTWMTVPKNAYIRTTNPTGRAVAWTYNGKIICFVPPPEA